MSVVESEGSREGSLRSPVESSGGLGGFVRAGIFARQSQKFSSRNLLGSWEVAFGPAAFVTLPLASLEDSEGSLEGSLRSPGRSQNTVY